MLVLQCSADSVRVCQSVCSSSNEVHIAFSFVPECFNQKYFKDVGSLCIDDNNQSVIEKVPFAHMFEGRGMYPMSMQKFVSICMCLYLCVCIVICKHSTCVRLYMCLYCNM